MKKKLIITFIFIGILLLIILFILKFVNLKHIDFYEKYSSSMIISWTDNENPITIHMKDDGSNAFISSTITDKQTYIFDNAIYYLDKNTFYKYNSKKNYQDIYKTLSSFIKPKNKEEFYETAISPNKINDLLDCLHFGKKTRQKENIKVKLKNNKLQSFEMIIHDIENYKDLKITINFTELEQDYNIDKTVLTGDIFNPASRREIEVSKENILEIINWPKKGAGNYEQEKK